MCCCIVSRSFLKWARCSITGQTTLILGSLLHSRYSLRLVARLFPYIGISPYPPVIDHKKGGHAVWRSSDGKPFSPRGGDHIAAFTFFALIRSGLTLWAWAFRIRKDFAFITAAFLFFLFLTFRILFLRNSISEKSLHVLTNLHFYRKKYI